MSYLTDTTDQGTYRCAHPWCRTSVDQDQTCPHGLHLCDGCAPDEVCDECAIVLHGPFCPTCKGATEIQPGGRVEHDTGAPITVPCPDCTPTLDHTRGTA